jgi:hypothetical protein
MWREAPHTQLTRIRTNSAAIQRKVTVSGDVDSSPTCCPPFLRWLLRRDAA